MPFVDYVRPLLNRLQRTTVLSGEIARPKLRSFIKNYGLRWQRQFVNFGRPVTVLGYVSDDPSQPTIDFAFQTGVYALYDGSELVYVGRAVKGERPLGERLRFHHNDEMKTDRWTTFSWFGFRSVVQEGRLQKESHAVRTVKTVDVAEVFEGLMIEFIRPRLNNRGGDLSHIDKYLQIRPETSDRQSA